MKHQIIATNWQEYRVYLYWKIPQPDGLTKTVKLGFLHIEDEFNDELQLGNVPDEIVTFLLENRKLLIDEAELE